MKVNAENDELILRNDNGDIAIIPKIHRQKALKHLQEGNHKALDELISGLPLMEDYADEGTIITDPPGGNKPTTSSTVNMPHGVYTEEEFDKLAKDYENPNKFAKFGQPKSADNPSDVWGCLGGSCKNLNTLYPQYSLHTDMFEKAGVYSAPKGKAPVTKGYPITPNTPADIKKHALANTGGVDSWEYPYIMQDYNLGKVLFNFDVGKENALLKKGDESLTKQRLSQLENFDQSEIPLGAVLSFGDAKEGNYVAPDAKSYRGKDEPLYRHSMVKIGNVEGVDAEGNPTVDVIYDDLGKILRVGSSTKAQKNWGTLIDQLGAITTRNDMGDWTYSKLKGDKAIKTKPKAKTTSKWLGETQKDIENMYNTIESNLKAGYITKEEAEEKKKQIPKLIKGS